MKSVFWLEGCQEVGELGLFLVCTEIVSFETFGDGIRAGAMMGSSPLPLAGEVGAISAFTRVFDALWRRGYAA